ncbi:MAG: tRNA pseudouridine(55) synthase TruB [Microscillaceae bacterium]|jgi:tRNA pseudouridine55 synthase|nr:tRNA pseudouridine(55) synthase TruB [Microscillaceae bacterium]
MNFDFETGEVLLIDKPLTWTSFDVVNKVRYALKKKLGKKLKVGHAGTLDPLATGLLIICTGKMTKQIDSFQAQEKEYTGEFTLGKTTPSLDAETEVSEVFATEHIDNELVIKTTQRFIGELDQIPPMFSAIKVNGKPVYKQARQGKEVALEARKISIREFEILAQEIPKIQFRVVCSKGTYIRSLARDFGLALDSGAYLTALTRTRIGEFRLENAWQLTDLLQELAKE